MKVARRAHAAKAAHQVEPSRVLKLLVIDWSHITSGAQVITLRLADELRATFGYEVSWVLPPGSFMDLVHSRSYRATESRPWEGIHRPTGPVMAGIMAARILRLASEIRATVRREHVDVVLATSLRASAVAAVGLLLNRTPLIAYVHDIRGRKLRHVFVELFASRILIPSNASRAQFSHSAPVEVLPSGFPSLGLLGRHEKLTGGTLVFGIVGQLIPWKGQEVFIKAASRVAALAPEARFVVIGADDLLPGERRRLTQLAGKLGLAEQVAFLGQIPNVSEIFEQLDILVHCSVEPDPYPVVICEAMAAGCPVIASRGGGVPELLRNGRLGLLYEPGNVDALVEAMLSLRNDNALRAELGRAARETARQYPMAAMAARAHAIFRRVLA